jgi:uracil-DNA glycosylase
VRRRAVHRAGPWSQCAHAQAGALHCIREKAMMASGKPGRDCALCPRLQAYRDDWRSREPSWFNAPVASFGPTSARLLIVGLAPGLRGANRTGRPFTGDYAGDLLYETLKSFGFACGSYAARPDDSLALVDARITNAVRCVPPENKPTPAEIKTCRTFLQATIAEMGNLRAIVTLGRISHDSTVAALQCRPSAAPFGHGKAHDVGELRIFVSYHCSRYNTSTGVLTSGMFRAVFAQVRAYLDARNQAITSSAFLSGGNTG